MNVFVDLIFMERKFTRAPYIDAEFSRSAAFHYMFCLDGVPNVTVYRALMGPGDGCLLNAISEANEFNSKIHNSLVIEHARSTMVEIKGLHPEYALAIRLYTMEEFKAYKYLNMPFNVESRRIELLQNQRLYMRLLIKSLLALAKLDNGRYLRQITTFRGIRMSEASIAKFDELYSPIVDGQLRQPPKSFLDNGQFYTFSGITSVTDDPNVATRADFCDRYYFQIQDVKVIDIHDLSMNPKEREYLIMPPFVVQIITTVWIGSRLCIVCEPVNQAGATYISDHIDDVEGQFDDEIVVNQWLNKELKTRRRSRLLFWLQIGLCMLVAVLATIMAIPSQAEIQAETNIVSIELISSRPANSTAGVVYNFCRDVALDARHRGRYGRHCRVPGECDLWTGELVAKVRVSIERLIKLIYFPYIDQVCVNSV